MYIFAITVVIDVPVNVATWFYQFGHTQGVHSIIVLEIFCHGLTVCTGIPLLVFQFVFLVFSRLCF